MVPKNVRPQMVQCDVTNHGYQSYYYGECFADETFFYIGGIRFNHKTGKVDYFPENHNDIEVEEYFPRRIDMVGDKIYIMEKSGFNDTFVVDTKTNIAIRIVPYKSEIVARMKNTLLWALMEKNFPNVTEDDYVMAKIKHPDDLYKMLNYIEGK